MVMTKKLADNRSGKFAWLYVTSMWKARLASCSALCRDPRPDWCWTDTGLCVCEEKRQRKKKKKKGENRTQGEYKRRLVIHHLWLFSFHYRVKRLLLQKTCSRVAMSPHWSNQLTSEYVWTWKCVYVPVSTPQYLCESVCIWVCKCFPFNQSRRWFTLITDQTTLQNRD